MVRDPYILIYEYGSFIALGWLIDTSVVMPLSNWRQSRGLFCPVLCSSGCLGNEEMKCLLTEQSQ